MIKFREKNFSEYDAMRSLYVELMKNARGNKDRYTIIDSSALIPVLRGNNVVIERFVISTSFLHSDKYRMYLKVGAKAKMPDEVRRRLDKDNNVLGEYEKRHFELVTTINKLQFELEYGVEDIIPVGMKNDYYMTSDLPISLCDPENRIFVGRSDYAIPVDKYEPVECADEFRSESGHIIDIDEFLSMFTADHKNAITLDSTVAYYLSDKDDDPITYRKATRHAHEISMINRENMAICEIIRSSKNPVIMNPDALQTAINLHLSGKGKKNTVIYTNHCGFAKIDVDVNGVALVTRDNDGRFIYKKKYPVVELPDEILPNEEDGSSPVIIGDLSVVKILMIYNRVATREENLVEFLRNLKKEVIALSDTTDKAYIHGTI